MTLCAADGADVLTRKLASPAYAGVIVLVPGVKKVSEQLPAPAVSVPVQLSPVVAVTVTLPVGGVVPVTVNGTDTAWPTTEGLAQAVPIAVVLAALVAAVDWLAV